MIVSDDKLDFWIKNNLNVLFIGKHGVGKTSIVLQAFERNNLKWKYFSCSTLDPWVDFIGVPREQKDQNGQSYLDLVRPLEWTTDGIQAIFMDEYNRSHKKIRNAVMELIQFKSINGKKFNNLKIIWAAINPPDSEDMEYDVEKIDAAQRDRFHIYFNIPYKPDTLYFNNKFGNQISSGAIEWWNNLPSEIKNEVSPRRLDYALQIYTLGGDIRDSLPTNSNVAKLLISIKRGSITEVLNKLLKPDTEEKKKYEFFANENDYSSSIDHILKNHSKFKQLIKYFPIEKISLIVQAHPIVLSYIVSELKNIPVFQSVLSEIIVANKNEKFIKIIKSKYSQAFNLLFPTPKNVQTLPVNINTINTSIVNLSATAADILKDMYSDDTVVNQDSTLSLSTPKRIIMLKHILANIPPVCTTDDDFTLLLNICDLSNCSSKSTLQKFVKLGETVQFLMDRIIIREKIQDIKQLKSFCKKTVYKQAIYSFDKFQERNRRRYHFIKDVDYNWYVSNISQDSIHPVTVTISSINPTVVHSNQEFSITDRNLDILKMNQLLPKVEF